MSSIKNNQNMMNMEELSQLYLDNIPIYAENKNENLEMEIKFGTGNNMERISHLDYENVIKRILSSGFKHLNNNSSDTLLRIFTNKLRTEIKGIGAVSSYCKTNKLPKDALIINKTMLQNNSRVFVDDFNFSASINKEVEYNKNSIEYNDLISKWDNINKGFRYINRHSFIHDDYPLRIDLSIVKEKININDNIKNFVDADLMTLKDKYEIEIEILNDVIMSNENKYKLGNELYKIIKKAIMLVLSGIQKTNYPISKTEKNKVLNDYMKLINKDFNNEKITSRNFIGPSSFTLQIQNIVNDTENFNIRKNYTVTDKADGERKLLFINKENKIYFIDTNMNVQFTGSKLNIDAANTLLDGELIIHNKKKEFINLFMAFDIYFMKNEEYRMYPFISKEKQSKSRLVLLNEIVNIIKSNIVSLGNNNKFRLSTKSFKIGTEEESIFKQCKNILDNEKNGLYEYEIDGLIFTPANYAVGMDDEISEYKPMKFKKAWESSFKWKPSEFNTIDFLFRTEKDTKKNDLIKTIYTSGLNTETSESIIEYKSGKLYVGYNEKYNPCEMLLSGSYKYNTFKDEYKALQFNPTNPVDKDAGICNIKLTKDLSGEKRMFTEENDVIEDNMIIEFRYDLSADKEWRWIPLRVRYDKTIDYRTNGRNFGNDFKVANSNWYSIHNPITIKMITTGKNTDDSEILTNQITDSTVYYKGDKSSIDTKQMREFHNKHVKKYLIQSYSKLDDTLIDLAVGKAGDLHKWIGSKLKFVMGIDISPDNIYNLTDGACARYIETYKTYRKRMPSAVFIVGDTSKLISSGDAFTNEKDKMIVKSLFGKIKKNEELGKLISQNYSVVKDGFDICSIQFAIHYMFKNINTLKNLLSNVSDSTKEGGYFIGTCFDGEKIFKLLKNKEKGENITYSNKNTQKKIWSITKQYDSDNFKDNETSLGYRIDIYQDTINETFSEYLVNYTYLKNMLKNYGFTEVKQGMFEDLYDDKTHNLSDVEKKISFLNRYFVFKKINNVNTSDVNNSIKIKDNVYEIKNIEEQDEKNNSEEIIQLDTDKMKQSKYSVTTIIPGQFKRVLDNNSSDRLKYTFLNIFKRAFNMTNPRERELYVKIEKSFKKDVEKGLDDATIYNNLNKYMNDIYYKEFGLPNILNDGRSKSRVDDIVKIFSNLNTSSTINNYIDFGCGEANITSAVSNAIGATNVIGMDIKEPKVVDGFKFIKLDQNTTKVPAENNSTELITCFMVLHHLRQPEEYIKEFYRTLKNGGLLIIREHDIDGEKDSDGKQFLDMLHGFYELVWSETGKQENPNHTNDYFANYKGRETWTNMIENNGFKRLDDNELNKIYESAVVNRKYSSRSKIINPFYYYYAVYKKKEEQPKVNVENIENIPLKKKLISRKKL